AGAAATGRRSPTSTPRPSPPACADRHISQVNLVGAFTVLAVADQRLKPGAVMHRHLVRNATKGAVPFATALLALTAGAGAASASLLTMPVLPTTPLSDDAFYAPVLAASGGRIGRGELLQPRPRFTVRWCHGERAWP